VDSGLDSPASLDKQIGGTLCSHGLLAIPELLIRTLQQSIEGSMSLENNDLAVSFWKQGKLSAERGELNVAIQQFEEAQRLSLASAHIRRSLHDVRRAAIAKGSVGSLARLKLVKLKAQLLLESSRQNWGTLLHLADAALAVDPWDGESCLALAEGASGLGHDELAAVFFERAAELSPESRRCLEPYAQLLEKTKRLDRALVIWQKIAEVCPQDESVQRRVTQLETLAFISKRTAPPAPKTRRARRVVVSEGDTIVNEGDTAFDLTPPPHPTRRDKATASQNAPQAKNDAPAGKSPPLAPHINSLLKNADRLMSQYRIREAVAVLEDASRRSQSDPRITSLLQVASGGSASIPPKERATDYLALRKSL
jgi:tetratricopeptide (TPR) repeat protein